MSKKRITSFDIDTSNLAAASQTRSFTITGGVGAEFALQIVKASNQSFYNFETKAFTTTFTPRCSYSDTLKSSSYLGNIVFPAGSTTDYQVLLLTPDIETEILQNGNVVNVVNKKISQISDVTITFAVTTANANTYTTSPAATNVTKTGSPGLTASETIDVDFTVVNRSHDDNAFGLIDNGTWLTLAKSYKFTEVWYAEKSVTVDGAVSAKSKIKLDDVSGLSTNNILKTIGGGGSVNGTDPYISKIDTAANTIELTATQSADDGVTLTFRGYGAKQISLMTGFQFSASKGDIDLDVVDKTQLNGITKTTRADGSIADEATDASSVKLTINGTYFVGRGAKVSGPGIVGGVGVSAITTVSSSAGLVTLDSAVGPLKVGQDVVFSDTFEKFKVKNKLTIQQYPESNTNVYCDLDKFITPGTSGL